MGRRSKGPWKRKSGGWWVWHNTKQVFLADTEQAARTAWHLLQAGEPIFEGPSAFREIADAYVQNLTRTRSLRHAKDAKQRLDRFVQPWWHRSASSLKWKDVEDVLASKNWNPTTQAGHLIALRGCLRWATKTRILDSNPIPHITIPRAVSRQDAMTLEQMNELVKHGGRLKDLLWFLSVTGARPGEAIKAKIEQCDADGTAVRLKESKVGRRIIFLPKDCRNRMATIRRRKVAGPIFPAPKGGHWTQTKFFEEFRAAKELAQKKAKGNAKPPDWATAYTFRHTWITHRLREKKISWENVAKLAGTSVNMIERTYGHLADRDYKAIADQLALASA